VGFGLSPVLVLPANPDVAKNLAQFQKTGVIAA